MKTVTYQSREMRISKTKVVPSNTIVELTEADDRDIKLRALALNWQIVSVVESVTA